MEAADAGVALVCSITDGIPAQDMMRVKRYLLRYQRGRRTLLVGPNCAGIISPGKAMLGIMPSNIYMKGSVGIVSRSGTLGYEAASQMKDLGIGVSTSVGIGGDPINGSSFLDHLVLFEQDPETEAVMMIGEIGGPQEAEAAAWIKSNMTKPVVGYVAGLTAPKGRRMGHAGAIISASGDSAAEKSGDHEVLRADRRAEPKRTRLDYGQGVGAHGRCRPNAGATARARALIPRLDCGEAHCRSPTAQGGAQSPAAPCSRKSARVEIGWEDGGSAKDRTASYPLKRTAWLGSLGLFHHSMPTGEANLRNPAKFKEGDVPR
ncbi:putative Succinate--CoA ligase (GDP-forming) [Methylocella tundrae]|uniref:Putative Succinate--CoA ligase (GDP-forming) n=1 Tax=Methylocella tundrae TaxID=227605 RepID=A0A4U8Z4Q4_METTU|nr:putative Succinate--CoA ligase (GDP-forming) [Methylocella tundrae]